MEATWATLKREIRHIHGDWSTTTRGYPRKVLFDYIQTFYNRRRHQTRLGHRTPAETKAASPEAAGITITRVHQTGSTPTNKHFLR